MNCRLSCYQLFLALSHAITFVLRCTAASSSISPPTWIPDDEVALCNQCNNRFTLIRRRHHCRNCGRVSDWAPLWLCPNDSAWLSVIVCDCPTEIFGINDRVLLLACPLKLGSGRLRNYFFHRGQVHVNDVVDVAWARNFKQQCC